MPFKDKAHLEQLIALSLKAGEKVMKIYNSPGVEKVKSKEDGSPLSLADEASHACIIEGLAQCFPGIPVISEEAALPSYSLRKHWKTFFLVDPLDGTKEFLKRNGEFTTNIALIEDKVPVMGVVHAPAKGLCYAASSELGSFKIALSTWTRLYSHSKNPSLGVRSVESRSHGEALPAEYEKILNITKRYTSGSSLKLCMLAEGSADVYPRSAPTMEWDVAAGDCVFRYSGKNTPRYSPLQYNKENMRNPAFLLGVDQKYFSQNSL